LPKIKKEAKGRTAYEQLKDHLKSLDIVIEEDDVEIEPKIGFRKYVKSE
jgi:hypothetical protein